MLVCIKGAGDLATGAAVRLHRAHFDIIMTDLPVPLSVRRTVAFSEAIVGGETTVEGIRAKRVENSAEARECLAQGIIPVAPDPEAAIFKDFEPEVLVDGIMAKKNTGTHIDDAPLVIAIGPGFTAGVDCDAVIETKRGHTLGRVITEGSAIPNTGVPGLIGGQTLNRLIKSPADGIFHPEKKIGELVKEGDRVANVDGTPVYAKTDGLIRGMLQDGVPVTRGLKSGDIDPRGNTIDYMTVSDKSLAIGGGVLEAIMVYAGDRLK